jgi:hypothetical protein
VRILCGLLFLLAVLGICIIPLLLFTNDFGIYIDLAIGAVAILRGFTARYFLRLALWKVFGKELIMFASDRITFAADYR